MLRFVTFIAVLLFATIIGMFAGEIKVNGTTYTGAKYKVYAYSENRFLIENDGATIGSATLQGDDFTISREEFRTSSTNSSGLQLSASTGNKIYLVITPKSSARVGSKGRVVINQFPGNTKNESFLFNFDFVLAANPEVNSIELVNSNIRTIRTGEIFKIKIKGSGLDNLILNLPANVSGKIIENNGKEATLELKAGKGFKGLDINQSIFGISQSKAKLNFKAKPISIDAK